MIKKLSIIAFTLGIASIAQAKDATMPTPSLEESYNQGTKKLQDQAMAELNQDHTVLEKQKTEFNKVTNRLDRVGREQ